MEHHHHHHHHSHHHHQIDNNQNDKNNQVVNQSKSIESILNESRAGWLHLFFFYNFPLNFCKIFHYDM